MYRIERAKDKNIYAFVQLCVVIRYNTKTRVINLLTQTTDHTYYTMYILLCIIPESVSQSSVHFQACREFQMKMKMMCPHDRGGGGGTKWRGFSIVSSQVMTVEKEKAESQRKRGTQGKSEGKFLRHLISAMGIYIFIIRIRTCTCM